MRARRRYTLRLLRLAQKLLPLILSVKWHLLPPALVRHAEELIVAISLSLMTFFGVKPPLAVRWDLCPLAICPFFLLLKQLPRSLMSIVKRTLSSPHFHSARLSLALSVARNATLHRLRWRR